jgi:hypothetical protein
VIDGAQRVAPCGGAMANDKLFSAGNCPVCADSGTLLYVWSHATRRVVLFCPLCEVAWIEPPDENRVDTVSSLDEIAPQGIRLPSENEVQRSGISPRVEVEKAEWGALIAGHLSDG